MLTVQAHKRALLMTVAAATLVAVAGCGSPTLRTGVWQLTMQLQRGQENFPVEPREVWIDSDWGQSLLNPGEEAELVEISPPPQEKGELPELYGEIKPATESRSAELRIVDAKDSFFAFRLDGNIQSPKYVNGVYVSARAHEFEDAYFDGRWTLRWLRDEWEE